MRPKVCHQVCGLILLDSKLRAGIDVLVGTPGRIKDHLDRGTLSLASIECDCQTVD
jgi:superfamily II DNA/RNA helicase